MTDSPFTGKFDEVYFKGMRELGMIEDEVAYILIECEYHDHISLRTYLKQLLADLWKMKHSFNAKKPFGYIGWDRKIYEALAKAGVINATFDEKGFLELNFSEKKKADNIVMDIIRSF